MRSFTNSGSSATPIANTMTTSLINSYSTNSTVLNLNQNNITDWECNFKINFK